MLATSERSQPDTSIGTRRILVLTGPFPTATQPGYGVFVKERMSAVAKLPGYDLRVISPTPYFPPIKAMKRWYSWSQFPKKETIGDLEVVRPKYFQPPKIGGYVNPQLAWRATTRAVDRIRRTFDFDLIDAHWTYPWGVLGTMLGERYGKPVVITGRGEDILRFPQLPLVGGMIRRAVPRVDRFIALSGEIASAFERCGAPADRITLIPNGVDCDKFRPVPIDETRRQLNLPCDRPIVVSVGALQERKGFHILVDSLPLVRRQFPDAMVVIVGGPAAHEADFSAEIRRRITHLGLQNDVVLAGPKTHDELYKWYGSADVFGLLSSREGSPNVLMEALACGTPAVATPVGGIPETLSDDRLGIVLPDRTAESAAAGVVEALTRKRCRQTIRTIMEGRSWKQTAQQVEKVFDNALSSCKNQ
ncbi:glycosyltransferase [Maioricimonas sp. JC845]|uniref:glycosyltransferase n=1 Tax=Maioricimonas sp. JC845 TaxID=3232138 RepID=UPI003458258E